MHDAVPAKQKPEFGGGLIALPISMFQGGIEAVSYTVLDLHNSPWVRLFVRPFLSFQEDSK